jgi:hypothetical protein
MGVLAKTARPTILSEFREDSCIASTRIVTKVLRRFGFDSEPMVVQLAVFNQQYAEAVAQGSNPPLDGSKDELIAWMDEHKAWAVGVGVPGRDDDWRWRKNGSKSPWLGGQASHLVAVMRTPRVLVDVSLSQANRPAHNIKLPDLFVGKVLPGFLDGSEQAWYHVNRCSMEYVSFPSDESFRVSPDWKDKSRTRHLVDSLERQVDFALSRS